MRRMALLLLVSLLACPTASAAQDLPSPPAKPNIVFILADDMRKDDLRFMPKTRALLAYRGSTFANAFVTDPLCCPSRATILTGQYTHNHRILDIRPPLGGAQRVHESGLEQDTIATRLQAAGYETALVGKYMNGYGGSWVPPGWDKWYAQAGSEMKREDGSFTSYEAKLQTPTWAEEASGFIRAAQAPFFLYFAPRPPHHLATPTPKHANSYPNARVPRRGSYNEADVSDKPKFIRKLPPFSPETKADIDERFRERLRTLADLDDAVAQLVATLEETGQLGNTYLVFTSDNGYHMGEHRLKPLKVLAYEEDIRVPLLVRGPGVPEGAAFSHLALNNDFAPTFAEWAGAQPPDSVDGRSLAPLLTADPAPSAWRSAFLVEKWNPYVTPSTYRAIRTTSWLYVRWSNGERELYNLRTDPRELKNVYPTASPIVKRKLVARLDALQRCDGVECRRAEGGP